MENQQETRYSWERDTKMTITGQTFGIMRALSEAILNDPSNRKVLLALELDKALGEVFAQGVQDGVIKPESDIELITPETPQLVDINGDPLSEKSKPSLELPA